MTNRFTEITNTELRTWNRCSMLFNIMKDKDSKAAARYAATFNAQERKEISEMYERIRLNGYEATRAAINRTITSATLVA